jgi:hypothetical protein
MVERYQRLYAGAYAPPEYVGTVRALIDMLQERHHVHQRTKRIQKQESPASEEDDGPEQAEFKW